MLTTERPSPTWTNPGTLGQLIKNQIQQQLCCSSTFSTSEVMTLWHMVVHKSVYYYCFFIPQVVYIHGLKVTIIQTFTHLLCL